MSSTSRETNTPRQIGPVGTLARVCVGTGLLIFGLTANPTVFELLAGFVVLPTAEMLVLSRSARKAPNQSTSTVSSATPPTSEQPAYCLLFGPHRPRSSTGPRYFSLSSRDTPAARSSPCRISSGGGTTSWHVPCSRHWTQSRAGHPHQRQTRAELRTVVGHSVLCDTRWASVQGIRRSAMTRVNS